MAKGHFTDKGKGSIKKKLPGRSAWAQHGMTLETVRNGNRTQIESALRSMEKNGEIDRGIVMDADDLELSQSGDSLLDSELDFFDEDELYTEEHSDSQHVAVRGNGGLNEDNTAIDPVQKVVIRVGLGGSGIASYSIRRDPQIGFDCNSPEASAQLEELASRYDVLERIGVWLAEKRGSFLQTGDWWDFAENALDEAIENRASVVQEDFIIIAGLGCRKDSFSRFIKNVVLSWGRNGRVGVGEMFSKAAKCAWVARAYREFCTCIKHEDRLAALETLRNCSASKKNESARRKGDLMSMSTRWVSERLCSLAHVKGLDVANLYEQKILEV